MNAPARTPGSPAGPACPDHVVERLACSGRVRLVLTDTDRDGLASLLDLGRSQRVVTERQYRALLLRDGGCTHPGCESTWNLEAHHVLHWLHGGLTDLANLVLLCSRHHDAHHRGEFTIVALGRQRFRFLREGRALLQAHVDPSTLFDTDTPVEDEHADVAADAAGNRRAGNAWTAATPAARSPPTATPPATTPAPGDSRAPDRRPPARYRRDGVGSCGEGEGAADDPEVAVRLGVVPEPTLGVHLVLLREQAGRTGQLEQPSEQRLGVLTAADHQVGLDEPGRADVHAALDAGQAVVVQVAEDRRTAPQSVLDRVDGGDEPWVVGRQQAAEADVQGRGLQLVPVVRGDVRLAGPRSTPGRRPARRCVPRSSTQSGCCTPRWAATSRARSTVCQHITFE